MYSEFDVLEDAEARAAARILADRLRYRAFLEAGERFVAENRLVVGGNAATRLLLAAGGAAPLAAGDFQYELYSGQGLTHARALADRLYAVDPEGLGHYTTVVTKVEKLVFSISVDGRDFFSVTHVPRVDGLSLLELLEPVARPAAFARAPGGAPLELLCAPPQVQLLQVYTALCSPARAADWPGLLETEAALRAALPPAFAAAGAAPRKGPAPARSAAWGRLHAALCRDYLPGPSRLVLARAPPGPEERLQVTTSGGLETEMAEIARLAAAAGTAVEWKANPLHFLTDWRLERATVFVVDRGGREAILDVFNAAAYELFPFRPAGATPPFSGGMSRSNEAVRGGRGRGGRGAKGHGAKGHGAKGHDKKGREKKGHDKKGHGAKGHDRKGHGAKGHDKKGHENKWREKRGRDAEAPRGARPPAPAWEEPGRPSVQSTFPDGKGARLKLATEPALLKFRLADLWAVRLAAGLKKIAASVGAEAAAEIREGFRAAAAGLDAARAAAEADPEAAAPWLFPADLLGRFEAADLALKREAAATASGFRHPPYLPLLAAKKGGAEPLPEARPPAPARLIVAGPGPAGRLYAESLGGNFEPCGATDRLGQLLARGADALYTGPAPAEALVLAQLAGCRAEVVCAPEDRGTPFGAAAPWLAQLADALVEAPAFYRHPAPGAAGRAAEAAALGAALEEAWARGD